GVLGGAVVMFAGAAILAIASAGQFAPGHSLGGVSAALGAGVLWGTMYIPYRKAYLTGMNPLSFVTFFTFGELGMMGALAFTYVGYAPLWHQLATARNVAFWLMLGGFIWVIGDLSSSTPQNISALVAAFPCQTPISCGVCSGEFWSSANCTANASRPTPR